MARMRSPDGSETVEVPDEDVMHYRELGATIVGPEEEPLAANPLNPLELGVDLLTGAPAVKGSFNLGANAAKGLARLGTAASRIMRNPGVGKGVGRVVGRHALEEVPVIGKFVRGKRFLSEVEGELGKEESKVAGHIGRRKPVRPPKKAAPKKGTAESRIARKNPGQRGASKPELERRAKSMESFKSRHGETGELEGQLEKSLGHDLSKMTIKERLEFFRNLRAGGGKN